MFKYIMMWLIFYILIGMINYGASHSQPLFLYLSIIISFYVLLFKFPVFTHQVVKEDDDEDDIY